jgi:hypothetical protein
MAPKWEKELSLAWLSRCLHKDASSDSLGEASNLRM